MSTPTNLPSAPTSTARQVYIDQGESIDVYQILGQGGAVLSGTTIGGLNYGTQLAQDSLTATPSGTQGNSILLKSINRFTVVASSGDAAVLPKSQPGMTIVVINDGANPMNIFPALGDKINSGSPNAALSLGTAQPPLVFYCTSTGLWRTK